MKISTNGIALIKREEGDKLRAYPDSRGIPTIGVGHTGRVNGKPIVLGMVITPEQSSALLRDDLAWVDNAYQQPRKHPADAEPVRCIVLFRIQYR